MNTKTFIVTLGLDEKVERDEDLIEISDNICKAISREAEEYGITPDNSEIMVKKITVRPIYLDYMGKKEEDNGQPVK